MKVWTTTIGSIASVQTGPFGSQLHNGDYVPVGTPIVTVEHLGARKMTRQNLPYVSDADKLRLNKYTLECGDLVFSRVGSVDRCSLVSWDEDGWMFSGRCLRVRPLDKEIIYNKYLYYYFTLDDTKDFVRRIAVGATMPSINTRLLSEVPIRIPSYEEQLLIADTLSSLDDRIEENAKINHHLEALAQAVFKSWFVDFEPFGGKMPDDWREGTINENCSAIYNGGTPRRNEAMFWNGTIPWLTSGEVRQSIILKPENFISEEGLRKSSAKWVPSLSTVVALYGATAGQVSMISTQLTTNQAICSLVPKEYCAFYNYLVMQNAKCLLENKAIGSAQQNISKAIVESTPCFIVDKKVIIGFDTFVRPIFNLWFQNLSESACLAALRDALLPRLMSGELSFAEIGNVK